MSLLYTHLAVPRLYRDIFFLAAGSILVLVSFLFCWKPCRDCAIDCTISTSFGNGPDEQTMIRWWGDDQFVIITDKAVAGTPITNNRITRGFQMHLLVGCWSLILIHSDIVDNGQIFLGLHSKRFPLPSNLALKVGKLLSNNWTNLSNKKYRKLKWISCSS